ncbi:MAG: hypothetical protein ACNYZH_09685 [Acidimicrobiia bacterium]
MTATIWTIGYGQRSFDDIEQQIADLDISMIIDIRASRDDPRTPDYDYRRLEELAAEAGIGYRWMGSTLGENSPVEIDIAVDNLIAIASASRTVVLCREPEPSQCRRSTVIAPALTGRAISVIHILPGGAIRPHESPLPFDR